MREIRGGNIIILSLAVLFIVWMTLQSGSMIYAAMGDQEVLATVGEEKITMEDLRLAAKKMSPRGEIGLTKEERQKLLDNLVARKLLLNAALKDGYDKRPDVLEEINVSKREIMIKAILKDKVTDKVAVTKEEMLKYYQDNKSLFRKPDKADITYAHVMKVNNKGEKDAEKAHRIANDIKNALADGKSFDEAIEISMEKEAEFSNSISKSTSRSVIEKGKYYGTTPQFNSVIFNLKNDEVGVVEVPDKFLIVKLNKLIEGDEIPFQESEREIENKLMRDRWENVYLEYVEDLKKQSAVSVFKEKIK